jgi:hypothetical protein
LVDHALVGNTVEAGIDLDAVEDAGVEFQVVLGRELLWIEVARPVLVGPSAAADAELLQVQTSWRMSGES